jgi:murein DD-endopeptidase MepM/ murein hydrolase activator NlpD
MKQKFIAAFALIFCGASAQGQEQTLELSSRYDDQGSAIIEVARHGGGSYSLVLELYELSNFITSKFHRRQVSSPGQQLLKLKPESTERSSSFRFRYNYIPGAVNPRKVDPEFIYRLPYSLSANKEAIELVYVNNRYFGGNGNSENFKSFQFLMNRADTIYSARKGVVVQIVDEHDPIVGMGVVSMNTENNHVLVEHADGTIARYGVLEKGSLIVKPGDRVYPGTPIALAGTLDGEIYQMRFDLYYTTDNLSEIDSLSDYSITYNYLDPVFSTSAGDTTLTHGTTYTPAMSHDMIVAEMTKREIRTLDESRNSVPAE